MSLASVIQGIGNKTKSEVYTMTVGEIVELDREYNRAKKVLLLDEDKQTKYIDEDDEYIYNIPYIHTITEEFVFIPPYREGDKVIILFSHRDIDNLLENDGSEAIDEAVFDKSDAVIIGGVHLFDDTIELGDVEEGELCFKKRDDSVSIHIDNDNNIEVKTDGKIYLGEKDDAEAVPLGEQLKEWLDNHTHDYNWTLEGGSGVTSPPKEKSPELSEKVFNE